MRRDEERDEERGEERESETIEREERARKN